VPGQKLQLILFDCDGTLVDSHGHIVHVMQRTFEESGLPAPSASDIRAVIGLSLQEAVRRLLPETDSCQRERIITGYRQRYGTTPDKSRLYTGVRKTLEKLRQNGYWLGIVTGKSYPGLMHMLDEYGLHELFHVWRTADVCPSKPHPAMVLECMQEMGVVAAQTTVVGDSCFDMQMARASGTRALGVSFGATGPALLLEAGATGIVHNFSDLKMYFPPCVAEAGHTR